MADGYILLYKQITDNPIWKDKPFARGQAWIDLLLMANFADGAMFSKGIKTPVKRGQVFRTIGNLAHRWGWSEKKVRRFLSYLSGESMVHVEGLSNGTLITIENYASYQLVGRADDLHGDTHDDLSDDPHREDKRIKNNKEIKERGGKGKPFKPPTIEEVEAYCRERNNGVDPVSWWNFYNSKNWMVGKNKMKNWKSAIVTWERRNKPADTTPQRPKRTQDEIAADIAHAQGMTLEEFKRAYGYD